MMPVTIFFWSGVGSVIAAESTIHYLHERALLSVETIDGFFFFHSGV